MTIPPVDLADMPSELQAQLAPRVERLGYVGEFFCRTAHQPGSLSGFIRMTEESRAALPSRIAELTALTMCVLGGSEYERNQHERLAIALGFDAAWVTAVERLQPEALPDPTEVLVQRWLIAAWPPSAIVAAEAAELFAAVEETLGPQQAVALLFLTGRFLVHGLIVGTLGLTPPVPSIFPDGNGDG